MYFSVIMGGFNYRLDYKQFECDTFQFQSFLYRLYSECRQLRQMYIVM
jgi:hypothetical protein